MQSSDESKDVGFNFNWEIENFLYRTKFVLTSPTFEAVSLQNTKWYLQLVEEVPAGKLVCYLGRESVDGGPEVITIRFCIYLIGLKISTEYLFAKNSQHGFEIIEDMRQMYPGIVVDGSFYIRLQMIEIDSMAIPFSECHAVTRMDLERCSRVYTLLKSPVINHLGRVQTIRISPVPFKNSGAMLSFEISFHFRPVGGGHLINAVMFRKQSGDVLTVGVKIHLVDKEGTQRKLAKQYYRLSEWQTSSQLFPLQISKDILEETEDIDLMNDDLNMLFQFTISKGVASESLITGDDKISNKQSLVRTHCDTDSQPRPLPSVTGVSACTQTDASCFQFYVQTKNSKAMCVTKLKQHLDIIISSKSAVNSEPYNSDESAPTCTSEPQGSVDKAFEDFDPHTLANLKKYLITEGLSNLSYDSIVELYFVAHKYRIIDLKSKCCLYMKSCLALRNVCQIWMFSVMHRDHELKSAALDFFGNNADEIYLSDSWKNFLISYPLLAAEIVEHISNTACGNSLSKCEDSSNVTIDGNNKDVSVQEFSSVKLISGNNEDVSGQEFSSVKLINSSIANLNNLDDECIQNYVPLIDSESNQPNSRCTSTEVEFCTSEKFCATLEDRKFPNINLNNNLGDKCVQNEMSLVDSEPIPCFSLNEMDSMAAPHFPGTLDDNKSSNTRLMLNLGGKCVQTQNEMPPVDSQQNSCFLTNEFDLRAEENSGATSDDNEFSNTNLIPNYADECTRNEVPLVDSETNCCSSQM